MNYLEVLIQFAQKFDDLVIDQSKWSQETFGIDSECGPLSALKDLELEAREAQQNPTDKEGYVECFLLILDAARRAGIKPEQLVEAAQEKMKKKKRNAYY